MNILKYISRIILKDEFDTLESVIKLKEEDIKNYEDLIEYKDSVIVKQDEMINELTYPNPLEEYYNNKYPKQPRAYYKKILNKKHNIDVRCFIGNYKNMYFPKIKGKTDDEKAIQALIWVIKNMKYDSDENVFGLQEYWAASYESLANKQGDCDDGEILLYDILRANGIPAWRLRLTCGWAINPLTKKAVGHMYLNYYSVEEYKWVSLDWSFLPNKSEMKDQPHYRDVSFYGDVWYSFNEDYSWGKNKIQ